MSLALQKVTKKKTVYGLQKKRGVELEKEEDEDIFRSN